jgi:Cu(I)/Ag(I) efflux system membrane fusion protein
VEVDNPKGELRPGMFADVVVQLGSRRGLVIPAEALVDTGEQQYVFLAREGGRFEPRRVRAGAREMGDVEILDGLTAGDVVVTTASFLIDSESRLRAAIEDLGRATPEPRASSELP